MTTSVVQNLTDTSVLYQTSTETFEVPTVLLGGNKTTPTAIPRTQDKQPAPLFLRDSWYASGMLILPLCRVRADKKLNCSLLLPPGAGLTLYDSDRVQNFNPFYMLRRKHPLLPRLNLFSRLLELYIGIRVFHYYRP